MDIIPVNILTFMIVVFIVFCVPVWLYNRQMRADRHSRIMAREISGVHTWYTKYFKKLAVSEYASLKICSALGTALRCDATQFRPDDSFDNDLLFRGFSFFGISSDDEMDLFEDLYLEEAMGERIYSDFEHCGLQFSDVASLVVWYNDALNCTREC